MKVALVIWYAFFKKAYNMVKKADHKVMCHGHVTMWYAFKCKINKEKENGQKINLLLNWGELKMKHSVE